MKKSKQFLLSIGMIVKNESRCLEKCLKALQPLREAVPCELVIADTGSDDGSLEIAARYADVLFKFAWINDFSAARNAVMDRCSGKWYLTVDADEYLDPDIKELVDILMGNISNDVIAGTVYQRDYFDTDMQGDYSDFPALRLLRMETGARYDGIIHEAWVLPPKSKVIALHSTILHHDGYALPTQKQRIDKLRRNMELLEKELEANPNDLKRLLQCCESSYNPQITKNYIRRSVEVIREKQPGWNTYGSAIYRRAIEKAFDFQLPELDQWIMETRVLFGESPFTKIDVRLIVIARAYGQAEYQKVLSEASDYWESLDNYDNNRFTPLDLCISSIHGTAVSKRNKVKLMEADSLHYLERWKDMKDCLESIKSDTWSQDDITNMLGIIYVNWEKINLSGTLNKIYRTVEGVSARGEQRQRFYQRTALAFSPPEDESYAPPYPLIAELDCDLGQAAKVMLAETPEEAAEKAAKIQDWKDVPAIVVQRLMDFEVPLPRGFFMQSVEKFEEIATGVAALYEERFTEKLLSYSQMEDFFETSVRFTWLFDLVIAAIQWERWEKAEPAQKLCDLFGDLAGDYLSNFYNAQLLTEEDIMMLPAVHRFGWYYMQARNAQDKIECVGILRAGLKSAPVMKKMVEFLAEQIEQENSLSYKPDPELLVLAKKIQTILAAYSPDDPAVKALMDSPAYQKVKDLIQIPW